MTIGILECGTPPAPLGDTHGDYVDMVRRLLGPGRGTERYAVHRGEWPAEAAACEAYVLTGSSAGVYDDLPWIAPLFDFIRAARGRAKLVGICFGHQAMAQALGGSAVKSPKGWGIGLHRYAVTAGAAWLDGGGEVRAAASHQDQVVTAPPGARVVAANAFTPLAALDYGDAISFQFHPEFTRDFAVDLLRVRSDIYGGATDAAVTSYAAPDDRARVAGWIFLDSA